MLSESWTPLKPKTGFLGRERGRGKGGDFLAPKEPRIPGMSAVATGALWPPHPGTPRWARAPVLPTQRGPGAGVDLGVGGAEGEPEVGEPECSSNCEPERKFKVPKRAPPPAPANRSPRAQGSALPGPVTASRALPEISPADEAAGWGHPDLSLVGGCWGEQWGCVPWVCPVCARGKPTVSKVR